MSAAAVDAVFAALADPRRRRAVELLGRRPYSAGELADTLGLAPPAMSRHLKALKDGGLVEDHYLPFDARVRIYALRSEPMVHLLRWLEESERLWGEQLLAFKAHVEGRE